MEVTLTPRGDELLRDAIRRHPDQSSTQIVEEALAERLERESAVFPTLPPARRLSPDEWDAALGRMAQFSDKIPRLPDEAFSREGLYQDHD